MPSATEILEPEEHVPAEPPMRPSVPFAFRALTYCVQLPLIAFSTAFFGSISLLVGLWDKSGSQQHAIARVWAQTLVLIAASPVEVVGGENLRLSQPAVFASNHLSYYDTPVLFGSLPFQFRILAKAPLWKIPFIGWYLNRSGQVPIDQSSARAGVTSLGKGVKTLQAGMPLVIFPEGGRAAKGELQPMAAGAAWIAIKAQVPIVPLTIVGTYELLPIHHIVLWPRKLKLVAGELISTAGMTTKDAEALTERLKDVIASEYAVHHRL